MLHPGSKCWWRMQHERRQIADVSDELIVSSTGTSSILSEQSQHKSVQQSSRTLSVVWSQWLIWQWLNFVNIFTMMSDSWIRPSQIKVNLPCLRKGKDMLLKFLKKNSTKKETIPLKSCSFGSNKRYNNRVCKNGSTSIPRSQVSAFSILKQPVERFRRKKLMFLPDIRQLDMR